MGTSRQHQRISPRWATTLTVLALLIFIFISSYLAVAVIYPKRGLPGIFIFFAATFAATTSAFAGAWQLFSPRRHAQGIDSSPKERLFNALDENWPLLDAAERLFVMEHAVQAYLFADTLTLPEEKKRIIEINEPQIPAAPDAQLKYLASIWCALTEKSQLTITGLTEILALAREWPRLPNNERLQHLSSINTMRRQHGLPCLTDPAINPYPITLHDIATKNRKKKNTV